MYLADLVDVRQVGSARHSQAVGRNAAAVGVGMGLGLDDVDRLRLAGILHDVGKIAVRGSILAKPGPLTDEEMDEIRIHPEVGARIVRNAGLNDIAAWVLAHHERPDGCGYPNRLAGAEIPLQALILAVADAYDAMTDDRGYRSAMSSERARQELLLNAGAQFDPLVVECFCSIVGWSTERSTA